MTDILAGKKSADYVNTGAWSKKAIGEAKRYCKVNVAADAAADNYSSVPDRSASARAAFSARPARKSTRRRSASCCAR